MATQYVDIVGSGYINGVPGYYSNVRVYYDDVSLTILHVGPLYVDWPGGGGGGNPTPAAYAFANVQAYNAKGDGVTDDTTAIANAIQAILDSDGVAGTLYFPPGIYITETQTLYSNIAWLGAGRAVTTIKLKDSTNADLLFGSLADALIDLSATYGTGNDGGITGWSIRNITLDGNKTNNSGSYCLRAYGYDFALENVAIHDGASGGVLLDWSGDVTTEIQSQFSDVLIRDCGGIGLQIGGPHGSLFNNVLITGCTSHALHLAPNARDMQFSNCYFRGATTSTICSVLAEANNCHFSGCIAGNAAVNVVVLAADFSWVGGHVRAESSNAVEGIQIGQQSAQTPFPGMLNQSSGTTTAVQVARAFISTKITNCEVGGISFVDDLNCLIQAAIYQTSGYGVNGTPDATTNAMILVKGVTPDNSVGTGGVLQQAGASPRAIYVTDGTDEVFGVNSSTGSYEAHLFNGASFALFNDAGTTYNNFFTNGTDGQLYFGNAFDTSIRRSSAGVLGVGGAVSASGSVSGSSLSTSGGISGASLTTDSIITGSTLTISGGGVTMSGGSLNVSGGGLTVKSSSSAASLSNGSTITTSGVGQARVTNSGAVTGIILQAGTTNGQRITVVNEGSGSVTFAAVGTSNVADGTGAVISVNRCMYLEWDTSKWYRA